ncbi:hypothetical protein HZB00_00605 [Candidatus Woesearchaeota archaeon]|nr:hypothetical protein [Candidatus Woesearchaeota archaeon]
MKKVFVLSVLFLVLVSVFVVASWSDFTGRLSGIKSQSKTQPVAKACEVYSGLSVGNIITSYGNKITVSAISSPEGGTVNVDIDGVSKILHNLDIAAIPRGSIGAKEIVVRGTNSTGPSTVTLIVGEDSCVDQKIRQSSVCQFTGGTFPIDPKRAVTLVNSCLTFGNDYVAVAEVTKNHKLLYASRDCSDGTLIDSFDSSDTFSFYDNNDGAGFRTQSGIPIKDATIGMEYTTINSKSCFPSSYLANFSVKQAVSNFGVWCCKKE